MINTKIVMAEQEVVESVTCDVCLRKFSYDDDLLELQEMQHISDVGGYGSVFGDGEYYSIDICQHCLKEKLGQWITIKD